MMDSDPLDRPMNPVSPALPDAVAPVAPSRLDSEMAASGEGTYCPRCGFLVHFEHKRCPECGRDIDHHPSNTQRYLLLGSLGFIFLGGLLIFNQPKAYHTFMQDLFECGIILCVACAGVCFFAAVVDMVRREGQ